MAFFSRTTQVNWCQKNVLLNIVVKGGYQEANTSTIWMGATPLRLIINPICLYHPPIFTPDALPVTTLPVYPWLGTGTGICWIAYRWLIIFSSWFKIHYLNFDSCFLYGWYATEKLLTTCSVWCRCWCTAGKILLTGRMQVHYKVVSHLRNANCSA